MPTRKSGTTRPCVSAARSKPVTGSPEPKHISTSYVERQNLTMRMSMRRFTRLPNAFSKKIEQPRAAVALYFMNYNFGRVHQTLRVTPVMEAGVTTDRDLSVVGQFAFVDERATIAPEADYEDCPSAG
jgi:hypothetical protein